MKILFGSAAVVIAFASSVFASDVATILQENPRASLIIHSGAHPNGVHVLYATHHFDLSVGGEALSQILIDLPEGIRIGKGIAVTNQSGQTINTTVSIKETSATIVFAQPVSAGTTLSVFMQGVETSDYMGRDWLYPIYGRSIGMNVNIPLGTAQIQTYK